MIITLYWKPPFLLALLQYTFLLFLLSFISTDFAVARSNDTWEKWSDKNSINSAAPVITDFKVIPDPACEGGNLIFSAQIGNINNPYYTYTFKLTGPDGYIVGVNSDESNFTLQTTARSSGVQMFTLTISTSGTEETTTSASLNVHVNPAPAVELLPDRMLDCTNPNVTLTATSIPGAAYSFSEGASQINLGNTATIKNEGFYSVNVTYPNGCIRSASVGVNCAPLPVKLTSFDAKLADDEIVHLQWNVTEQLDIAKYIVEFSEDARNFTAVGTINANHLIQTKYQFEHIRLHKTRIAYYRLRIQESAGGFAFSRVVSVRLEDHEELIVYPNPASTKIWVKNPGMPGDKIQIIEKTGVILKSIDVMSIIQQIDISTLQVGFYIIKTATGASHKFYKD